MGFFSWITQDTGRSIANSSARYRSTFRVIMTDDKGNNWIECDYEGYGVFGGKDYYELLAEMNMVNKTYHNREIGIDLEFKPESLKGYQMKHDMIIYPMLTEEIPTKYFSNGPESCDAQGFFYASRFAR